MVESFNCIEILANKYAAKFVNKSTSQPARRAMPTGLHRARVYVRSTMCKALVCACTRIRNTLKCSPVFRETPPHPYSAVSHANETVTIGAILAETNANTYFETWRNYTYLVCFIFTVDIALTHF